MSLEFFLTPGKRFDSKLVYTNADRQLFKLKGYEGSGTRYVCYLNDNGCKAKINLKDGVCTYISGDHNHGHQEDTMKTFKLAYDIKVRCQNESTRPKEIFTEECLLNENQNAANQIQFGKMRRSLNKNRKRGLPNNPTTVDEVKSFLEDPKVNQKLFNNSTTLSKFTIVTQLFTYVIFASEEILASLPEIQNYLVDGTFKVVPAGPFKQLLTISIENQQHIFPVFYVLMTSKTQVAYEHLFNFISDHWNLNPTKFMSDYERGLRNAIRKTYPGVPIKGCWFHYCQAIRKRAASIPGFFQEIYANQLKRQLYHKFLSLPLLKESQILNAFQMLKRDSLNFEDPFKNFLQYFERQWIRREGPSNICVYFELNRTNNLSESYNSYLKRIMHCHGSFYDFISVLLKEEKRITRDYRVQMNGGDRVFVGRRKKYANRDEHIKVVQKRLEDELIDVSTFLAQVTFADNTGAIINMDSLDVGDEIDSDGEVFEDDVEEFVVEEAAIGGSEAGVEIVNTSSQDLLVARLRSEVDSLRRANNCVVCLTSPRNTVIKPCGHVNTCQECTDYLRYTVRYTTDGDLIPPSCPICREPIVNTERAYL